MACKGIVGTVVCQNVVFTRESCCQMTKIGNSTMLHIATQTTLGRTITILRKVLLTTARRIRSFVSSFRINLRGFLHAEMNAVAVFCICTRVGKCPMNYDKPGKKASVGSNAQQFLIVHT